MSDVITSITGVDGYPVGVELRGGKVCALLDVRGLQIRRSDSSKWTRTIQKELVLKAVTGVPRGDIVSFLRERYFSVKKGPVTWEEFGIPAGITKPLKKYGKKCLLPEGEEENESENERACQRHEHKVVPVPIHARAAQWSNANLGKEYGMGDKPRYFYIEPPRGKSPTNVVAVDYGEAPGTYGLEVDVNAMLERCFFKPFEDICTVLGIKLRDVVAPAGATAALERWF